jgi:hypothetical protein
VNDTGPITTWPRRIPAWARSWTCNPGNGYETRPLHLLVAGVRPEISRWYGGN